MPRVLHVVEAIEAGVARHVTDVVTHVEAEHHVLVPAARTGGFTDLSAFAAMESAGASVHLTPMRRSPVAPGNVAAAIAARRLIRRLRPDVVHGHASIGGAVGRAAATGTGVARVYTPHCLLPRRSVIAAERGLARLTDAFVAVSRSEKALIEELGVIAAGRITVIPNGIDLDRHVQARRNLRDELGVAPGVPLIGTVCRLAPQKAPEIFLRACALVARSVDDARFVLIGDGPMRSAVAVEIEASGLGSRFLHVPGMLDADSVIPQFDVFVLPSRYEAGPYAPLEAMRARVPVVLTDVVGNRDTVSDERTGLLVPPDDPGALAAAVERILGDPELAGRLVGQAGERLAADFDVRVMAERLGRLYREVGAETALD